MPTKMISIGGEKFEVTAPYAEGHVCTATEAKVLNQTRAENIGNNFRAEVKKARDEGNGYDAVRASLSAYDAEYTFAMGGTTRTPTDPVEREAQALASAAITAKLKDKGIKLKDYLAVEGNQEKYDAALEKLSMQDDVIAAARKRVEERKKVTEFDLSDDLGLNGGMAEPAEETAA